MLLDISKLSPEIIDKYKTLNNALKAIPKDDWKDRTKFQSWVRRNYA